MSAKTSIVSSLCAAALALAAFTTGARATTLSGATTTDNAFTLYIS